MRFATSLVFIAVSVVAVWNAPTSSAARGSIALSFGGSPVVQEPADPRARRVEHRLHLGNKHRAQPLALVQFDTLDDGSDSVPLSAPTPSGSVAAPALMPAAQLPACHETIEGVIIFRGRPCRS